LVEIQGNFCDIISTCVVIPLVPLEEFIPAPVLNPTVEIAGKKFLMSTAEITVVLRSKLGQLVGTLGNLRTEILQAIDRLIL